MKTFRHILLASLLTSATSLLADPAEPADGATRPAFRYGGDIRLRQELWDDIPLPTEEPIVTRNGFNNTYRLRTRAFAAYDFTDWATVNIRLTHMFYKTIAGPESFKWPDELSPDNVNLEFRDLTGEGSKLVVGRQDIFLGSGRLVFEGTPLDAARTTFFDGILLHQPTSDEFHSVDIFAVYNKDEDPLAIGHVHRQLRGYSPAVDGRDDDVAVVRFKTAIDDENVVGKDSRVAHRFARHADKKGRRRVRYQLCAEVVGFKGNVVFRRGGEARLNLVAVQRKNIPATLYERIDLVDQRNGEANRLCRLSVFARSLGTAPTRSTRPVAALNRPRFLNRRFRLRLRRTFFNFRARSRGRR